MEYRAISGPDAKISLLGFGAMRLPLMEGEESKIDYDRAARLFEMAIEGGVNYFDTAYGYHGGTSETFVGKALAGRPRQSYYLASKMPMWHVNGEADTLRIFNEQLERCQTDYFDFYLFHALNWDSYQKIDKYGMWQVLDAQRKAGRIRRLGFSFHDSPEVLEKIAAAHRWDFAQIQLNYLDWEMQHSGRQYEILTEKGIPCIVMEPVRGGRLADLGADANAVLKRARPDASIASWAIRFAASLPNVLTVLSGMNTEQQLQDNLATTGAFEPLTQADGAALEKALEVFKGNNLVPCTACRYCMPCPAGVDIPGLFQLYNRCALGGGETAMKRQYVEFDPAANASHCVACGSCEAACPQHIPVISWMDRFKAMAAE